MKAVQSYARSRRLSLGKAASELIRRGARYQLAVRKENGFPVFNTPSDFPKITTGQVRELLNEE